MTKDADAEKAAQKKPKGKKKTFELKTQRFKRGDSKKSKPATRTTTKTEVR